MDNLRGDSTTSLDHGLREQRQWEAQARARVEHQRQAAMSAPNRRWAFEQAAQLLALSADNTVDRKIADADKILAWVEGKSNG